MLTICPLALRWQGQPSGVKRLSPSLPSFSRSLRIIAAFNSASVVGDIGTSPVSHRFTDTAPRRSIMTWRRHCANFPSIVFRYTTIEPIFRRQSRCVISRSYGWLWIRRRRIQWRTYFKRAARRRRRLKVVTDFRSPKIIPSPTDFVAGKTNRRRTSVTQISRSSCKNNRISRKFCDWNFVGDDRP